MTTSSIATIEFHGQSLITLQHDSQPFVAMKSIVEGMGLAWVSQFVKLKANSSRWGVIEIIIPSKSGDQETLCMPLRKLPGWLMTIHPNKIKDLAVRERVVMYQNECDDALWQYWSQGEAINPRSRPEKTRKALPDGLTIPQQEAIKQLIKARVEQLPKAKQAKASITCWSAMKSKFGVSYKEISPDHFTDALSLISRIELEGEWLPKQEPTNVIVLDAYAAQHVYLLMSCIAVMNKDRDNLGDAARALDSKPLMSIYSQLLEGSLSFTYLDTRIGKELYSTYLSLGSREGGYAMRSRR